MTPPDLSPRPVTAPCGAALRAALALRPLLAPLAAPYLRRRLAKGREDPARWREKLGEPTAPRPPGRVVWLHAVGLGEVLALRGLIAAMAAADVSFLVTSSARSSARAFAAQVPPRTLHQFLPLDLPGPVARFLGHWRPDLAVWAEQDLWPGLVVQAAQRGMPLALVNARMDARALARRRRAGRLFADLYARFALIAAQDDGTAGHLRALGAGRVAVTGSLKPAAGALSCDAGELARLRAAVAGRRPWLAAATHPGDEATVLSAAMLRHDRLLIVAPRDPVRGVALSQQATARGLDATRRSDGMGPQGAVWIADTLGEMGLWYRLCDTALIGGQGVGGHSPWEAVALGCAVLHGPDVANFAADYAALDGAGAAREVKTPEALAAALAEDPAPRAARARGLTAEAEAMTQALAAALLGLMR